MFLTCTRASGSGLLGDARYQPGEFARAKGATVCDVVTVISEMLDANLLTSMDMGRFRKGMSDAAREYDVDRFKQLAKRIK